MIVTYTLALAASAKRLSDVFGGPANAVDESKNIPFRQLLLTATGAAATIGGPGVTTTTGVTVATTAPLPLSIGPFTTGPVKLADLYAVGAGSTLTVLGVPY
jgi:hypothetical protein